MTSFSSTAEIQVLMDRFRLASRELFNTHCRPAYAEEDAWSVVERHQELEKTLFWALVAAPAQLGACQYGEMQPLVVLTWNGTLPWMLNRDVDSGYWDHPVVQAPDGTQLNFVAFFQWDWLSVWDYCLARAVVTQCAANPALVGKHAIVDVSYFQFARLEP